jgi:hypothetical protein
LIHSYGPQNNDKVKEPANEVAVFPRNHQLDKVVEMKGIEVLLFLLGFQELEPKG